MIPPTAESGRRRGEPFRWGAVAVAALAVILAGDDGQQRRVGPARVTRGGFRSTVVLTGSLVSLRSEEFKVPVTDTYRCQIKWMAEEGANVKPGDAVVRFDTANLASDIENGQDSLRSKREELAQKVADHKHQTFELDVEVRRAENDNKQKAIDASIPPEIEAKVEYERKQLEKKKSDYTLDSALTNRVVKMAESEARIKTLEIEVRDLEAKLERLKDRLNALTLTAHTAGGVLYAVDEWTGRKVQVGDTVFATRTVAQIPDMTSLEIQAWISETHIQRINPGDKADLSLDAYPGTHFGGIVGEISKSAETVRRWGRSHYFRVRIGLERIDTETMKPGMSVKCELQGPRYDDALLIPLEMTRFDGQSFWVRPARGVPLKLSVLGFNDFTLAVEAKANPAVKEGMALEPVGALKETKADKGDEKNK